MTTAEQFSNNATANFSASVAAGDLTVTVDSYTNFPASTPFRIWADDEAMLVTAGAGTTTWTVTRGIEGTSAASHAAGSVLNVLTGVYTNRVAHVITAASVRKTDPINILANGVEGDDSDETTAIQNVLTNVPEGSRVHFSSIRGGGTRTSFRFSALTASKSLHLSGDGWECIPQSPFGTATYQTLTNTLGSVLISTATSGAAITFDANARKLDLSNLLVVGSGSGTPTGALVGTAAHYTLKNNWSNVKFANFTIGVDMRFGLDGTYQAITTRGCKTGLSLSAATNQNLWLNTEVQNSDTDAVLLADATGNRFVEGLLQNVSGTAGIRTSNAAGILNQFVGWWYEACTATYTVDFASGGYHSLEDSWFSTTGGDVRVNASGSLIAHNRAVGSNTLTVGGTGVILIAPGLTVIDNGTATQYWNPSGRLSVNGLRGSKFVSPTALAADTNDYDPGSLDQVTRLSIGSTGAVNLTGIVAQSEGVMIWLHNRLGFSITLKHNSAGSAAANRFFGPNSADVVLRQNGSVWLLYDATHAAWLIQGA